MWLLRGVEQYTNERFIIPLVDPVVVGERRDHGTLLPLMHKCILPRSVIITDQWKAYNTLSDHGYTHPVTNHSKNFVDPVNLDIYTQNAERLQRGVKELVKQPGIRNDFLDQYLVKYLFIQAHDEKGHLGM